MRFLWAFLGWFALLVGALLVAITIVNPRREFSGTAFPALNLNTRQMKADLFDEAVARTPPAGIIVGSSRSMNLQPEVFSSITGESFFNFGVFNASIEDDLAVVRYILARDSHVRDLVVGVDIQSFDSHIEPLDELDHNARLSGALNGELDNPLYGPLLTARVYRDALTVSYLADVLKSARNYAHPPESAYSFDSVGVLLYPRADGERKAGTYDWDEHFNSCAALQKEEFASYGSLGVSKRAMLDSLINEATAKGIHVVLWAPPVNPALAAIIQKDSTTNANYSRATSFLLSLARPPLVTTSDQNDTALLPDPKGWYDCMHFDSTNSSAIATSLARAVLAAHASGAAPMAAR
jgi:hypothetical protein